MLFLFFIVSRDGRTVLIIKLKSPDHTLYIVGMNGICAYRIHLSQHFMEMLPAFFFCKSFQLLPVIIFLLSFCKINILCNCLNIKPGSTYQNGYFSSGINILHGFFCHLLKFYNMKFFLRFQNIHQIMRNSLHFFRSDLCGTNIHFFIYLHGICRYDLSIYCLCKGNGKTCFSYCRRSGQYDQGLFHMALLNNSFKFLFQFCSCHGNNGRASVRTVIRVIQGKKLVNKLFRLFR